MVPRESRSRIGALAAETVSDVPDATALPASGRPFARSRLFSPDHQKETFNMSRRAGQAGRHNLDADGSAVAVISVRQVDHRFRLSAQCMATSPIILRLMDDPYS
jgi:hypothetical protein